MFFEYFEKIVIVTIALAWTLMITGCGVKKGVITQFPPPLYYKNVQQEVDKKLIEKVCKYWHYRKTNQPEKSFEYEVRKIKGKKLDEVYRLYVKHMSKAKVDKIEIISIKKYDEGICLNLKFYLNKPNKLGKKVFFRKDCWMKVDNDWFHLMGNKLMFKY